MKARVIFTRYVQVIDQGEPTERRIQYDFGSEVEVDKETFERGVESGALQAIDAPLPDGHNSAASVEAQQATQPDGTPLENEDGSPMMAGPDLTADGDWTKPRTHAQANDQLRELNLAAPADAKLPEKIQILDDYRAAQAAGAATAAPATQENLSELDDAELIQRAIDFGREEEELAEKDHDELVLIVADSMAFHSLDPAEQTRAIAERHEQREELEAEQG